MGLGLSEVLITCDKSNGPSVRTIAGGDLVGGYRRPGWRTG